MLFWAQPDNEMKREERGSIFFLSLLIYDPAYQER